MRHAKAAVADTRSAARRTQPVGLGSSVAAAGAIRLGNTREQRSVDTVPSDRRRGAPLLVVLAWARACVRFT